MKHYQQSINEFMFHLDDGNWLPHTQERADSLFAKRANKQITNKELTQ